MMSLKLSKYNIKSSLKPIMIYYCIVISVLIIMTILTKITGGDNQSNGLEFISIVFLFIIGLNSFKENFYFTQANNISRLDFFKASAISIIPISICMSILDVIINRVYNLFQICPTMYDMAYDSFNLVNNHELWIQSNSIKTLFGTVAFLFAFYIVAFAIGLLITIIYYKCNKIMKILVSLSPIAIMSIFACIESYYPAFGWKVGVFIDNIFGISAKNSYMAVLTFICLFIISMSLFYMLIRKAVVKRA